MTKYMCVSINDTTFSPVFSNLIHVHRAKNVCILISITHSSFIYIIHYGEWWLLCALLCTYCTMGDMHCVPVHCHIKSWLLTSFNENVFKNIECIYRLISDDRQMSMAQKHPAEYLWCVCALRVCDISKCENCQLYQVLGMKEKWMNGWKINRSNSVCIGFGMCVRVCLCMCVWMWVGFCSRFHILIYRTCVIKSFFFLFFGIVSKYTYVCMCVPLSMWLPMKRA